MPHYTPLGLAPWTTAGHHVVCLYTSKRDRSGPVQFKLTCSVNVDRSAPTWPRLDHRLLVVWFNLEGSFAPCEQLFELRLNWYSLFEHDVRHIYLPLCMAALPFRRVASSFICLLYGPYKLILIVYSGSPPQSILFQPLNTPGHSSTIFNLTWSHTDYCSNPYIEDTYSANF